MVKIFDYLLYYYSGGIKLIFAGRDLDVVSTVFIIDIVDNTTNSTVLAMPYDIVSVSVSRKESDTHMYTLVCSYLYIPVV